MAGKCSPVVADLLEVNCITRFLYRLQLYLVSIITKQKFLFYSACSFLEISYEIIFCCSLLISCLHKNCIKKLLIIFFYLFNTKDINTFYSRLYRPNSSQTRSLLTNNCRLQSHESGLLFHSLNHMSNASFRLQQLGRVSPWKVF